MKVRMLFETGYEEVEALTVVDLLRRAKVDCLMVAADDQDTVTGSHGITVKMDEKISELADDADMIVLPGGMPGVTNLIANEKVRNLVCGQYEAGRYVAAICAAPSVLGAAGLLEGRHATCHPGFEEKLTGAITSEDAVVVDGNIITSRGMGTAIDFGLAIVDCLTDFDEEVVEHVKKGIVYRNFEEV